MINLVVITLTAFLFLLVGSPYAWLMGKSSKIEHYSLAFLVGSGLTTWFWFIFYNIGFPLTVLTLLGSSLFAYILGIVLQYFSHTKKMYPQEKISPGSKYWLYGILIVSVVVLLVDLYQPVTAWDSLTLYDFRAKVINESHSLSDAELSLYYLDYPYMTSLTHAIAYAFGGNNPQSLYAFTFIALIGVIYGRLRDWTNQKLALIGSLLTATSSSLFGMSVIAYTNLPYAAFLTCGLLYGVNGNLIISGILLGLSTWVRSTETFWIIGILLILTQGIKNRRYLLSAISVALTFLIRQSWLIYRSLAYSRLGNNVQSPLNSFVPSHALTNLSSVIHYLGEHVFFPYLPTIITLFIVIPFLFFRHELKLWLLWLSLIFILGMTFFGTLVLSTYFPSWYSIGGSATRMLVFLAPLGIVLLICTYNSLDRLKYGKK